MRHILAVLRWDLEADAVSFLISVLTKKTDGSLIEGTDYSRAWSGIVLLSMLFYVASYATGLGNVPWQQAELFGLEGSALLISASMIN